MRLGPDPPAYKLMQNGIDGASFIRLRDGMTVIISLAREQDMREWIHLSCAHRDRLPTYADLCEVKAKFLGPEREAVQVFPKDSEKVNIHNYCLHLFSTLDGELPIPDFTHGQKSL